MGEQHACALLSDGTATCWGDDSHGQLGPTLASAPNGPVCLGLRNMAQISASGSVTCVRYENRTATCRGQEEPSTSNPDGVAALEHIVDVGTALAVLANGSVAAFGFGAPYLLPNLSSVARIFEGQYIECALHENRTVSCAKDSYTYDFTAMPGLEQVAELALGYWAGCARLLDGTVSCWDDPSKGSMPGTQPIPASVPGLSGVVQIAASDALACAVKSDASVWCWGTGYLGDGKSWGTSVTPVRVKL